MLWCISDRVDIHLCFSVFLSTRFEHGRFLKIVRDFLCEAVGRIEALPLHALWPVCVLLEYSSAGQIDESNVCLDHSRSREGDQVTQAGVAFLEPLRY